MVMSYTKKYVVELPSVRKSRLPRKVREDLQKYFLAVDEQIPLSDSETCPECGWFLGENPNCQKCLDFAFVKRSRE